MMYVIANINLNDEYVAKELKMDLNSYNKMIIDKWNSCVTNEDSVYVFGIFGKGKRMEMKELIPQLKGKIYIVNYASCPSNLHFTVEEWKSWGINYIWTTSFYYKGKNGIELFFPTQRIVTINPETQKVVSVGPVTNLKENQFVAATNDDNLGIIFKNNMFSLDAKYWDYTPIALEELPEIVLRLKEYEQMEDK